MQKNLKKGKSKKKRISHAANIQHPPPPQNDDNILTFQDRLSRVFMGFLKKKSVKKDSEGYATFVSGQYIIKGLICEGTFGKVMRAVNKNTNVVVAAKLEPMETIIPQLHTEYKIYEILGSNKEGFIKIFHYGPCDRLYNALIMELLGPDLDDLFIACKSTFSHKTVLMIAMQTIKIIKYIHDRNIIYRDIKPENFCIGNNDYGKQKIIHIIDFGLSKIRDNKKKFTENPNEDYNYLVGTARYMSINAHFGKEQSKRDDLEALGYVYMYFLNGRLPWMGMSRQSDTTKHYRAIADSKVKLQPEETLRKYPEFISYITNVKNLKFNEQPDYEYLYNLMKERFIEKGYVYDQIFDWTPIMNKKYLKKVIDVDPDE